MRRGSLAHAVLERTLRQARRAPDARIAPGRARGARTPRSPSCAGRPRGTRARAQLRELEVDLRRLLRHEAECGAGLEPRFFEWGFGGERGRAGPLPLPERAWA